MAGDLTTELDQTITNNNDVDLLFGLTPDMSPEGKFPCSVPDCGAVA